MLEEALAYIEYLSSFGEVKRPLMPTFPISAYTDNEYQNAIMSVMKDYENIDDFDITLKYLKGE